MAALGGRPRARGVIAAFASAAEADTVIVKPNAVQWTEWFHRREPTSLRRLIRTTMFSVEQPNSCAVQHDAAAATITPQFGLRLERNPHYLRVTRQALAPSV
jgi:hypothetical protein